MSNNVLPPVNKTTNPSLQLTSSRTGQSLLQNASAGGECVTVLFSQMEFLPWDNPDNLISEEAELIVRRIKDNVLVLLFLIGGPVNVINMAVFYKQGLKDRVNLCLFSLALADELYLISALLHYGEQLHMQFTTEERFGPMMTFLTNHNLIVLTGLGFVSPALSTIIATERCLCVFNPLKFQTLLRTKTMLVIIVAVYVLILGLFFVVVFRYRIGCVHDPELGVVLTTIVEGEFYKAHRAFIDQLDGFVFGVGLSGTEVTVVTITTILTIVKLRQVMTWRSETTSSFSAREVALTRMLIGNSILFITCITPNALNRFTWLFFPEVNSGGRHQNFFLAGIVVEEMFTYFNSTFNFFVYFIMGSKYRETFWALFGRKNKA